MWSFLGFAAFLVAASALLLWHHQRVWQAAQTDDLDERDFDFRRRQYRRRMQASAMIGIVGVAVAASLIITDDILAGILWIAVLALVAWMLLLALADLVCSVYHYRQLRAEYTQEQVELKAKLKQIHRREGNGQAHE